MALKHRKQFTSSLENNLLILFRKFSDESRINQSKLMDEAITDLLIKHGVDIDAEIEKLEAESNS